MPTPRYAPVDRSGSAAPLLEREREVQALAEFFERTAAGAGGVALVEAGAGLGKSRLLVEATRLAGELSIGFAAARARELDVDAAFGVVQQLFQPLLARADRERRQELLSGAAALAAPVLGLEPFGPAPGSGAGTTHGLYWLAAGLAAQQPLVLAVDDAHWADAPSLAWLAHLARRLDGLALGVLLAARPPEESNVRSELVALSADPDTVYVELPPLSASGVGQIVERMVETAPDPEFTRAVHEATRGNPFFVRELLRSAIEQDIRPSAAEAPNVRRIGPKTIVSAVVARLEHLPKGAVELARAASVLESSARLEPARALADLGDEAATTAWTELVRAGVLEPDEPLRFVHPVVRAAIYQDLPARARGLMHRRAAQALSEHGAPIDLVAAHLLASPPAGDPWVVETLRAAARLAAERGAPRAAVTHLRRATGEPPPSALEAEVLLELGKAEAGAQEPATVETLSKVLAVAADRRIRAAAALHLGQVYVWRDRVEEALGLLDAHEDELLATDRELALELECSVLAAARMNPTTRPVVSERLRGRPVPDGSSGADRALLAHLATEAVMAGESADTTAQLARRALADGPPAVSPAAVLPVLLGAARALAAADGLEPAGTWLTGQLEGASGRGDAMTFAVSSAFRSEVAYRMGDVLEAEADARSALSILGEEGAPPFLLAATVGCLVDPLLEGGKVAEARAAVTDAGVDEELPLNYAYNLLLLRRGRLHAAEGRQSQAVDDLLECGRREELWRALNPAVVPWRSSAALALHAVGDTVEARRLAREEVDRARRFGAARALGVSLRVSGLMEGGAAGIALLEEAVRVLEHSPAPLERARAGIDLGAALRRAKQWGAARPPLQAGLDVAERCGAPVLASRAREELAAAGVRAPRERTAGAHALTASELRVAQRAAEGLTNREIAQGLFVTVKTVEKHLASTYRKLHTTRDGLSGALERVGES